MTPAAPASTAMSISHDELKAMCARSINLMADGVLSDFEAVVHPDARNREAAVEPAASRGTGPAAFYATALW